MAAFLETGKLLIEAKKALPHGEYQQMVKTELSFHKSVAHKLRTIAQDKRVQRYANRILLPPHYRTVYELILVEDDWNEPIRDGRINPGMTERDARALRRLGERAKQSTPSAPPWTQPRMGYGYPLALRFRESLESPSWLKATY